MACSGECKWQVYDFDLEGLKVENPTGCSKRSVNDLAENILEDLAGIFPESAIEPKCAAACSCIPLDEEPKWTVWVEYSADLTITTQDHVKGSDKFCDYKVTGTYHACSAVLPGTCMKTPRVPWKRPKNKTRPKDQKKGGLNEAPKDDKKK